MYEESPGKLIGSGASRKRLFTKFTFLLNATVLNHRSVIWTHLLNPHCLGFHKNWGSTLTFHEDDFCKLNEQVHYEKAFAKNYNSLSCLLSHCSFFGTPFNKKKSNRIVSWRFFGKSNLIVKYRFLLKSYKNRIEQSIPKIARHCYWQTILRFF